MTEYVHTPDIFDELERTPVGKGGEIWLTDAVNQLAARGGLYAYEFEGRRYDVSLSTAASGSHMPSGSRPNRRLKSAIPHLTSVVF